MDQCTHRQPGKDNDIKRKVESLQVRNAHTRAAEAQGLGDYLLHKSRTVLDPPSRLQHQNGVS